MGNELLRLVFSNLVPLLPSVFFDLLDSFIHSWSSVGRTSGQTMLRTLFFIRPPKLMHPGPESGRTLEIRSIALMSLTDVSQLT